MRRRFIAVSAGLVLGLSAAVVAQAGGGGVTALSPPAQAQTPAVVIPDPVFEYDGGPTGTVFNGSRTVAQSQDAVNTIKDLREGTIVVSFDVADETLKSHAIVSASDSGDSSSEFCFCIGELDLYVNGAYGAFSRENGSLINDVQSARSSYFAGRITAVLSVSQTNGTVLMTSQDFGESWSTQRDSSMKSFFSSVTNIDRLVIGGNRQRWTMEKQMKGVIYFVEVYSTPFTEEQSEAKIKESYLSFPGGVSYIQTNERTFQFNIEPPIGDLSATYAWEFQGGGTSTDSSPTWTIPGSIGEIPARVRVKATISSSGVHHGFQEITTIYVAPEASSGNVGRPPHFKTWVFKHGEDGLDCYRIPAIIRAGNGDLLAFVEGRPRSHGVMLNPANRGTSWRYNWQLRIRGDKAQICPDHQHGTSVVMKRSVDNGLTWGPMQVIAENIVPSTGRQHLAQNVTPILDKLDERYPQGKLVIVYNETEHGTWEHKHGHGVRRTIAAWSGDHGHTWNWNQINSPPGTRDGDITNQVSYPYNPTYTAVYDAEYTRANYDSTPPWSFAMTALGHSIQLNRTPGAEGRLLVAAAYAPKLVAMPRSYSASYSGGYYWDFRNYLFWSDDHGENWEIGGVWDSGNYFLNEAIAVELEDGGVLVNSRAFRRGNGDLRAANGRLLTRVSFDSNGRASFGIPRHTSQLATANTAAAMARITTTDQAIFGRKSRIAYSGPHDLSNRGCGSRYCMSLWMSTDEGNSWNGYGSRPKLLNRSGSGYSDVVALPDARVGVLYEGNLGGNIYAVGAGTLFDSASLHWLSDGDDQRALVRRDASSTSFDGSSGFVDLSSQVGEVDDMTEGSVVVSFKTGGAAGGQTLFSVSDSSDADSVWGLVQTGDGRFGVYARNDSTDVNLTYFDRDLVTDGLWHQMAVTVGSDGTDVYVDGEHVAHTESTGFFADVDGLDAMDLGRVVTSGGAAGFWDGSIGTLEVFDGVLTAEQAVAATQPAAMPVAAFHVDQDLTADNAITMATAPGGTDLVADHLPQWECNELAASWAIGTTFTAPDSVTDQATVFQSEDSVTTNGGNASTASLMLGIWGPDGGERIGLRYDSPAISEWDLSVPFDQYQDKKVSMIAVMGPVNSYLIINGQTVATTPTPVPEGPHIWHPASTTIGTTNTDHTLGTNLKTLAIWKGVVPSTPLAQSLTLAHNITR